MTWTRPEQHSTSSAYRYVYYANTDHDLSGTRSAGGWLKAVQDPTGGYVAFGYDAAGNTVRTWDRNATAGHGTAEAFPTDTAGYSSTLYGTCRIN